MAPKLDSRNDIVWETVANCSDVRYTCRATTNKRGLCRAVRGADCCLHGRVVGSAGLLSAKRSIRTGRAYQKIQPLHAQLHAQRAVRSTINPYVRSLKQ